MPTSPLSTQLTPLARTLHVSKLNQEAGHTPDAVALADKILEHCNGILPILALVPRQQITPGERPTHQADALHESLKEEIAQLIENPQLLSPAFKAHYQHVPNIEAGILSFLEYFVDQLTRVVATAGPAEQALQPNPAAQQQLQQYLQQLSPEGITNPYDPAYDNSLEARVRLEFQGKGNSSESYLRMVLETLGGLAFTEVFEKSQELSEEMTERNFHRIRPRPTYD